MTNKKIYLNMILITFFLSFVLHILLNIQMNYEKQNVYYYNLLRDEFISGICYVNRYDKKEAAKDVLAKLASCIDPFHDKIGDISVISYKKGNMIIDISGEYLTGNKTEDMYTAYSVIKSMCECGLAETVKITYNGKEAYLSDGNKIDVLSEKNIINKEEDEHTLFAAALYFQNSQSGCLERVIDTIKVYNDETVEWCVINALLEKPDRDNLEKSVFDIPLSVKTVDGICFVNMPESFIDDINDEEFSFTIYSIVNSLTELPNINMVQFLIDGCEINNTKGFSLENPLTKNNEI